MRQKQITVIETKDDLHGVLVKHNGNVQLAVEPGGLLKLVGFESGTYELGFKMDAAQWASFLMEKLKLPRLLWEK